MSRPHSPKIRAFVRSDGTTVFTMRLMVDGERRTIQLGDERDGATPLSARAKRKDVLEDIQLGRWEPDEEPEIREREPGFAEVARRFLDHKRSRQLRTSTIERVEWIIGTHLVPFFGDTQPSRITERDVVAYSDHQIAQRARIAQLRSQGKYLTGPKDGRCASCRT